MLFVKRLRIAITLYQPSMFLLTKIKNNAIHVVA